MGVLLNLTKEYFKDDVRSEDGMKLNIWGKKYIMKFKDIPFFEDLIPLNEKGDFFIEKKFEFFDEPVYICVSRKEDKNRYYRKVDFECHYLTKENMEYVENNKIEYSDFESLIDSNYNFTDDDFLVMDVLYYAVGMHQKHLVNFNNCFIVDKEEKNDGTTEYTVEGSYKYRIFKSHSDAEKAAKEKNYEDLKGDFDEEMNKNYVREYIGLYGENWIDIDKLKGDFIKKMYDNYKEMEDETTDDDGNKLKYGNKLYEYLIEKDLIQDDADYFETDKEKPKFDIKEYREKLIEKIMWLDNVSKEEATEEVNDFDNDTVIEQLIGFNIIDDDETYFELNYNDANKEKIDNAIYKLIDDELDECYDYIELYLDKFNAISSDFYDLEELSNYIFERNKDDLGSILSEYEEYSTYIGDDEYFVYITEE